MGEVLDRVTMQVFVRDHCTMIAAPVQCDVDGIPKGSHYVRVPIVLGPPNDIEFSGERKRVRCNEGLAAVDGWSDKEPPEPTQLPNVGYEVRQRCSDEEKREPADCK